MTLDEAIKHCEEVVDSHNRIKQIKAVTLEECRCADEHRQLAEWLKELKDYRKTWDEIKKQIKEESNFAYADFDEYKYEVLGVDDIDDLPSDEFRYGMERTLEIINEHTYLGRGRMTQFTLDEFIEFFEREAKDYKNKNIEVMAKDYQNLTEWLRELKTYRENSCKDAISREQVLSVASKYMCALNHVLLTLENLPFQENKGETMLNRNPHDMEDFRKVIDMFGAHWDEEDADLINKDLLADIERRAAWLEESEIMKGEGKDEQDAKDEKARLQRIKG